MNVLFISTPGIRRRHAFNAVLNAAISAYPRETIFTVPWEDGGASVASEGIPIIEDRLYSHNPATLLEKSAFLQRQEWHRAFQEIQKEFRASRCKHFFLGAHLLYRYGRVPSVAADLRQLAQWRPDCIVTLTDDIYCVRERVHQGGHTAFTFQELLLWRLEELLLGDVLARLVSSKTPPPNYLISVRHPVRNFVRLIFAHGKEAKGADRRCGRVYLSFNISDTRHTDSGRNEIDAFRRKFFSYEDLFVFDPLMIDELPPVYQVTGRSSPPPSSPHIDYDPREPRWRWPWLGGDFSPIVDDSDLHSRYPLKIPVDELRSAAETIDTQVSNRDIRLVDQAHYLALWRPTMTREASVSAGVRGEMEFARDRGVRMLTYVKKGADQLPGSSFLKYLNPHQNPDVKFEEDDDEFWRHIEEIRLQKPDLSRDHFLA